MNVTQFHMEPEVAERKLAAYKKQLRRRANEEWELAVKAYAAAAKGQALLNIVDVMQQAGLKPNGLPQLAIARADRQEVEVSCEISDRQLAFRSWEDASWWRYEGTLLIRLPFQYPDGTKSRRGYAMVPMVPADVAPTGQLKGYFTLWEVEQWSDRSLTAPVPRDPYLLKHIAGELYAVVAEWDLTELERAIMAGRRRRAAR